MEKENIIFIIFLINVVFFSFQIKTYATDDIDPCYSQVAWDCAHASSQPTDSDKENFKNLFDDFISDKDPIEYCTDENKKAICQKTNQAAPAHGKLDNLHFFNNLFDDSWFGNTKPSFLKSIPSGCPVDETMCYIDLCSQYVQSWCNSKTVDDSCSAYISDIDTIYNNYFDSIFNSATNPCQYAAYNEEETAKPFSSTDAFCGDGRYSTFIDSSDYCKSNPDNCSSDQFKSCANTICVNNFSSHTQDYKSRCYGALSSSVISNNPNSSSSDGTATGTYISVNKSGTISCDQITSITNFFNDIYSVLEIIAVVALVVLTMLDFAKAVMSDSEKTDEDMKKAKKHFVTRIAIVTVLVLLPILVKIIINAIGGSTCYLS